MKIIFSFPNVYKYIFHSTFLLFTQHHYHHHLCPLRVWNVNEIFSSTFIHCSNLYSFLSFLPFFQWNLICNRSMLSSLTQTVFMVGYIPSGLILALVADRIGRKSIIWTSFTLEILAGISCIFSFSIWQFIISRLLLGIAVCMRGNVLFALCKNHFNFPIPVQTVHEHDSYCDDR